MAMDDAQFQSQIAKYNRIFDDMVAVEQELKSRPGDERRALLSLYQHPNAQVRLNAARATLAVERQAAMQALQDLYDSKEYPQAGDAGMSLINLERGIHKPT